MRRSISAILAALALLTIGSAAQAHDDPTDPAHKHGLQIKNAWCTGGAVTLEWQESTGTCDRWNNECAYTCLYQVWSEWEADDGYRGRDTEPRGGYYRCHIERSGTPNLARTFFQTLQPGWGTGNWGVHVRDGWDRKTVRCN